MFLLRGGWMDKKNIAAHPSWGYVKSERYRLKIGKCCEVVGCTEDVRRCGILFAQYLFSGKLKIVNVNRQKFLRHVEDTKWGNQKP